MKYFTIKNGGIVQLVNSHVIFAPEEWNKKIVYRMRVETTHRPAEIWEMYGILRRIDEMWNNKDELTEEDEKYMKLIDKDLSEWILYLESNVIKQWAIAKEESIRYQGRIEKYALEITTLHTRLTSWRILAWISMGVSLILIVLTILNIH